MERFYVLRKQLMNLMIRSLWYTASDSWQRRDDDNRGRRCTFAWRSTHSTCSLPKGRSPQPATVQDTHTMDGTSENRPRIPAHSQLSSSFHSCNGSTGGFMKCCGGWRKTAVKVLGTKDLMHPTVLKWQVCECINLTTETQHKCEIQDMKVYQTQMY